MINKDIRGRGPRRQILLRAAAALTLLLGAAAAALPAAAEEAAVSQSTVLAGPAGNAQAAGPLNADLAASAPEQTVALDETNFPDPAFLDCVRAFDLDGDGALSESERAAVTKLDVRGKGIRSLDGVGFFPALTQLNCIGNALTELPLDQTPNLTNLLCNENQLTGLDLSQVPRLEALHCHDNRLAALDPSAAPLLRELACGHNLFETLDVSRNGALQYLLYLGGPLKTLTLDNNEALIDLWCSYTLVTQLDLSHAPNLELLGVERSDLTFLDLSANPRLTDVMAGDNQLLALRAGPAAPTAVLDGQRPVEVQLADGQTTFDLAQLGIPIDPAHISGVTGAQLEGSVLTGLSDGSLVTYRYTDGPFSFTASLQFRVSNAWVEPLTIDDWTYGEAAHPPHATAQYGQPVYEYSDSETGVFTSQPPTEAGTWYVRALVPPQDGHAGLVAVTEFHILKAIPPYTVPSGLTAVYGSTLDQVDPGPGFAWNTPGQTVGNAGPQVFEARFVPADTENYETVENVQVPVQVLPKDASLLWVSPVANAQDAAALTVRDGDAVLREGADYTVETRESGGRVTITLRFFGNYTGTVERGYDAAGQTAPPVRPTPGATASPAPGGGQTATPAPQRTPSPTPESGGDGQARPSPSPEATPSPVPSPSPMASPSPSPVPSLPVDQGGGQPPAAGLWLLFSFLEFLLLALLLITFAPPRPPAKGPGRTRR